MSNKFKTEKEVKGMKYPELIKYATSIGVKYEFQKKPELLNLCLSKAEGVEVYTDEGHVDKVTESNAKPLESGLGIGSYVTIADESAISEDMEVIAPMLADGQGILKVRSVNDDGTIAVQSVSEAVGEGESCTIAASAVNAVAKPRKAAEKKDKGGRKSPPKKESKPEAKDDEPKSEVPAKKRQARQPAKLNEKQVEIMSKLKSDDKFTKSDAARKLYQSGMTIGDVAKHVGIHYSFAYCVIDKYRKAHLQG